MNWFQVESLSKPAAELYRELRAEHIIWETTSAQDLDVLRRDVARIAGDMDDPGRPPAMFWSGIPWPAPGPEPSCDYNLIVSLGGSKTDFALLRLERGQVIGLDVRSGEEVSDPEKIDQAKTATQMDTPVHGPATPTGQDMVAQIARHLAGHLGRHRRALERCEAILLSWGFPHSVVRTGPRVAGGLSAISTKMTKGQAKFTRDLLGKNIGELFAGALEAQLGWSRPIAVANDTVMALHWFLAPARRAGHARVGLFINGTGTNFSAAEAYAVRPEGFIARPGEEYAPERITRKRPLRPGEHEEVFFVNYEAGSTDLVGTRTRFDTDPEYPIERNALAGGNAFSQQLEALTTEFVSKQAYETLRANWRAIAKQPDAVPGGPTVSALIGGRRDAECLRGLEAGGEAAAKLRLIARAILARSAIHMALVLAAVTYRTGFGKGKDGLPDLLGMEGSVWKSPSYPDMVRDYWQTLVGNEKLAVDFAHEPYYNASLPGPLYLAAIHKSA